MSVSIITPITEQRACFLPTLEKSIGNQDYKGLIEHVLIWDSGTIGHKRNLGCQRAKGDIIIHMDSDDWYGAEWVSRSVDFMASSKADIVGLSSLYFYNDAEKLAWKYHYPKSGWVAGATMCYRRSFWESHNFPNMQIGEDNEFCQKAKVEAHSFINDFLARIHPGNSSRKVVSCNLFTPVILPPELGLLANIQ